MTPKEMSPCELAQWMRTEQESLKELSKVLRQHIAAIPEVITADWLRGLKVGFERLKAHLERTFEAQEEGGYLSIVTENRPTLSPQVEELRSEHQQILQLAHAILRDIEQASPEKKVIVRDICARAQRFMEMVAEHDHREVMLTMVVCSQDLGGKG